MSDILKELAIYQAMNGEIKLKEDAGNDTIYMNVHFISFFVSIYHSILKNIRKVCLAFLPVFSTMCYNTMITIKRKEYVTTRKIFRR